MTRPLRPFRGNGAASPGAGRGYGHSIVLLSPALSVIVAVFTPPEGPLNSHVPAQTTSDRVICFEPPAKPLRPMLGHVYWPFGGAPARLTVAGRVSSLMTMDWTSSGLPVGAGRMVCDPE